MGSRNGTYVNRQKVQTADLKDGDQIKAGRTLLQVSVERPEAISADGLETIPPEITPIHRILAKEPGARFADVGTLRQALLAFCD